MKNQLYFSCFYSLSRNFKVDTKQIKKNSATYFTYCFVQAVVDLTVLVAASFSS